MFVLTNFITLLFVEIKFFKSSDFIIKIKRRRPKEITHKLIGNKDGVNTVGIYPEDEGKPYFKISFSIHNDNSLSSFTVHDKSNSIFIYSIDDFLEEELDNSLFSFEIENYPDIEVIDFR